MTLVSGRSPHFKTPSVRVFHPHPHFGSARIPVTTVVFLPTAGGSAATTSPLPAVSRQICGCGRFSPAGLR